MENIFKYSFDKDNSTNPDSHQIDLPQFTEIDAEIYTFAINIHGGKNYHAVISNHANEVVSIDVIGKKLIIREKKPHAKKNIIYTKKALITLTLPIDNKLLQTKIRSYAGSVTLFQLTMQDLDIDLLAGSAKLTNLTVHSTAKIDLSAGSLKLSNCKMNLKADLAAGSANIQQLHGQNHLMLAAGSLTLSENKADTTSYDLSSVIGSVKYQGENYGHHFYHQASGPDRLVVKTSVGSIRIK